MQTKLNPANFFLNSVFFFLLFLIPFLVIRLYFYFNYFFAANEFVIWDFLRMLFWGLRFDLCVIGFLLIPVFLLYLVSYNQRLRTICSVIIQLYKAFVLVAIFVVLHLNIPFLAKNAPFDIPYWMHWPDYRSLFFLDCRVCYWDLDYQSTLHPLQIVSSLIMLLILFSLVSQWKYFSDKLNPKREVLFFVLLALMARGKVGEHHLRYEDSVWHKNPLINTLSNNPLWLIDKVRN
tara:strand:- start:37735 stop:38436 length:702 start_codon:yes stop_codon:yes gene_type:complete